MKKFIPFVLLISILLVSCSATTKPSLPLQTISLIDSIDETTIELKNFAWHSPPDKAAIAALAGSYKNCAEMLLGGDAEPKSILSIQFPIYIEELKRSASMTLIYRQNNFGGVIGEFSMYEYSLQIVDEEKENAEKVKQQSTAFFHKILASDSNIKQFDRDLEKENAGYIANIRINVNNEEVLIPYAYSWRKIENQPQLAEAYCGSYVFQFNTRCTTIK